MTTRDEVVLALRQRYLNTDRRERGRILDEFAAVAGVHGSTRPDCFVEVGGNPVRSGGDRRLYDGSSRRTRLLPNTEVGAIHPKAMPVILRTPTGVDQLLSALTPEALVLQRPLPDGSLTGIARGTRLDSMGIEL
jgi:hypothetical protein